MKPITFENIRRLMGGGRKKKEKESSFKRSDSFKRISIRKNYLDRGGKKKHHQKQLEALCDDPHEITAIVKPIVSIVQEVPEEDVPTTSNKINGSSSNIQSVVETQPKVVPYGQWLKGVKVTENKPKVSTVKGAERTVIYIPAADEEEHLTSLSVPQQPASVVTITTNGSDKQHFNSDKNNLSRKVSNDSAVELFPWGDSIEVVKLNKSPTFRRRNRPTTSSSSVLFSEASGGNDEMCSLSVSLGRIWMDAPMVMSPRSLELPRSSSQSNETTIHHSLDSGLKERRDDPLINRLQTHYPKKSSTNSSSGAVSRTLSSSTQNSETKTTSSNMFSSKDSGFSFSISIPKLTDSSSSNIPSSSSRGGFFRSKRPKPKLSVSRDGYFKRTSMVIESKNDFNKRTSNRSKKGNRNSGRSFKKKTIPPRTDLYQVIVNRPPRCLKNLKLDPMIFVPPEKRKTSIRKKQSFKLTVREIREYRKEEIEPQPNYETLNSSLYESISGDFYDNVPSEIMSGRKSRIDNISLSKDEEIYNFSSERSEIADTKSNVENSSNEKVFDEDDSNITSDFYSNGKKCSLREFFVADIQPPSTSSKTQQTESVSDCDESRSSDNVSTSSSNYEPEEDDDSDVLLDYSDIECVPLGVSPVPKKRPVRRRKSALSQKRAVSYVARPGIYRTPSTLRYSKSKKNKVSSKMEEFAATSGILRQHNNVTANNSIIETDEERVERERIERQQSLRDLEELYVWLQQFEDPPATSTTTTTASSQSNDNNSEHSLSSPSCGSGGHHYTGHYQQSQSQSQHRYYHQQREQQQHYHNSRHRSTSSQIDYISTNNNGSSNYYQQYDHYGDITQKGYEKKRTRLLSPYVPKQAQSTAGLNGSNGSGLIVSNAASSGGGCRDSGGGGNSRQRTRRTQRRVTHNEKRYHSAVVSTATRAHAHSAQQRRGNRRLTRNESRYHSEVRQEAVQQALAAMQNRPKPSLPMPSKRTSVMAKSPDRERHDSASSSDDDSLVELGGVGSQQLPPPPPPPLSDTSSAGSPPPHHKQHSRSKHEITDITDVMHNLRPYTQPPDVTHNTAQNRRPAAADRVNRYGTSASDDTISMGTGRWKVSAKIQQLLNTLKRPKRRPLPEFYEDDDIELEIAANPKDPNAPKPEGSAMTAAVGEPLVVPTGLPRNLEAAIQRYGSASFKAPVATVSDPNGKLTVTLTYGKLLSRSHKIAYTLLNKCFSKGGESSLKSGDRIALVYPNNDPINFLCALYGCFQAGIVPVPIEVPLTRRDAGSQQIGFLLGSCGIQVALTSEACLKGLPKTTAGDVVTFKGWPKLHWLVTEHLPKPPKDWLPPPRLTDDTPAYIEYSTDREGSVMGVTVTRAAMLNHCRMLTMACGYTEGENMVCVLDFKREVGLWHGVLTSVLNGMHVIYIPYAVMKVNPASWMQMITKYRASVAIVKSRDLHWGLLATKDHKDINLASLRMLLIADGANPWSLSSCDQFLSVFQTKGLRPDAVCPCACSSEVLTVSLRRPGRAGAATGRGVLSMAGLSHGVVRVDQENSLTSLTLQDCGQVMPGCEIVVIKMDNTPYLCKTDEVGEICVSSGATGSQYWGLPGLSNSTFRVQPLTPTEGTPDSTTNRNEKPTGVAAATGEFTRSGLLGFLGPGGLVFVCGSRDGLMTVTGRKHNADDIIATVLAVEPMKFIYRGRIAVFSIRVLRDERICVIAEQRPDCSEEESFQWMSRVLQAVDSIHQVGVYCLALVPANHLPKTPLGGIHLSESRRRFLEGTLHPANVLMCPHTCVTNLPKPREVHSAACVADVGPASVIVGNLVQGNRLASAQGRELGPPEEESSDAARKYLFLSEILRWRAHSTPDHVLFTLLNAKGGISRAMSCAELHKRAERVASLLSERGRVNTGAHVALVYPPGLDLVCAFYGCLYVGAVPVTIRPPHPQNLHTTLPTVRMIVDVSKAALVLSSTPVIKLLRSKEAGGVIDIKSWPPILDTDDATKRKPAVPYKAPTAEMLAYLDFSVSTTGMLAGIKMSHSAVTSLCRSMKLACELYPSRHVALCLDPYCGLGFALWVLSSVYSGHHSILIPPSEVEVNPALWLTAVSQHRVRDTFCSYGVMELCTKGLGSSVGQLKARGLSLACVRTCVVVAEERPRIALTTSFSKLFSALGLSPRAVSTSFGCRVNVAICLQGAASPEPSSVYVDLRALRNDRVTLVERGSPHSLCLLESGKLLPGVKVIIANPESRGQCGDSHLGEIWVQAPHCASGYFTIYGDESEYADHFNAKLVTGGTGEVYCRTGYLGFLRRTEGGSGGQLGGDTDLLNDDVSSLSETSSIQTIPSSIQQNETAVELHDAVFVVGALDETIMLRGMRYHPIDIENSVLRCHKKIAECAVFTWTNLLVVVVELDGNESEALDVVPLVTNTVLEEQQLVVGVVVVVDPGVVPVNSRGEKQRMHLRDGFLADQLDPIYVAYNM